MAAEDIGSPEIGFPILEDGSEIDIDDIVGLDRTVRRVVGGNGQRVGTRSHDALMPMLLDAEIVERDGVDLLLDLALVAAGSKQASPLDFIEQFFGALLRGN